MTNKHKGSIDSFLEKEGILDGMEAVAVKKVITYQLEKAMQQKHRSKSAMAVKMHTSRSGLERLLDPNNPAITLITLVKAAHVLGKKLQLSLA